jgi:hypothetical protein
MNKKRTIAVILVFAVIIAFIIQFARLEHLQTNQQNTDYTNNISQKETVVSFPEDEASRRERDRFKIIISSDDTNSIRIKNETVQVLKLMKKDFVVQDLSQDSTVVIDDASIVVCVMDLGRIANLDKLAGYVENGGGGFFAVSPLVNSSFQNIYRKLGIVEGTTAASLEGIKIVSGVLIKGEGFSLGGDNVRNTSILASLDKGCKVLATDTGKSPLMWEVSYGSGKFVVFNGTMLNEKRNRGLLAGGISLLKPDYIYPVFNLEVIFIDDFPAPFPEGYDPAILRDYGRSIKAFFRDVWWSDILRIMTAYNLKFTGAATRTYDDRVEPPFPDIKQTDSTNMVLYGRELLTNAGEIGMHGYNHQSLVMKGEREEEYSRKVLMYKIFSGEESIAESIRAFRDYFNAIYPNYVITSYVPPSNVLGKAGRKLLKKDLPQLENISSVYYNNLEGSSYAQEFEIAEDGILEFPRLTYGYARDELNDWAVLNGICEAGVVSHFIHPDDLLDSERSGSKSWDELSKEFDGFAGMINSNYPWLRGRTMTEAGHEARRVLSSKVFFDYRDKEISGYINGYKGEYYFILRSDKTAYPLENCTIEAIDNGVYLVDAKEMTFRIGLRR